MFDQDFAFGFDQVRSDIGKVDALQRLIDVELPERSIRSNAVPIENTISSVAVLLNFHEQVASTNRVQPACRQEHRVARFHANFLNAVCGGSFIQRTLELLSSYQFAKSKKKFCAGISDGYVPEFGFGFAA